MRSIFILLLLAGFIPRVVFGDIRFEDVSWYPTGGGSTGACVADFDGDLDLDYAIANRNTDSVTVYVNDGTGVFGNRKDFLAGINPRYV